MRRLPIICVCSNSQLKVQMALQKKEIDMGHARAILSIDSPSIQVKLFNEVQKNGYSVRKVEEMVQQLKNGETIESGKKRSNQITDARRIQSAERPSFKFLQYESTDVLHSRRKGKISISFSNEDELLKSCQI